jgi:hypothetical protein
MPFARNPQLFAWASLSFTSENKLSGFESRFRERCFVSVEGSFVSAEGRSVSAEGSFVSAEGRSVSAEGSFVSAEGRSISTETSFVSPADRPLSLIKEHFMSEWFPGSREKVLAMADVWDTVLTEKGSMWNIPIGERTSFTAQKVKTRASYLRTLDTTTCTAEEYAQADMDFAALTEMMRYIKNNYFDSPPRTPAELASLMLHKHAGSVTTPAPEHVLEGSVKPTANGVLVVTVRYLVAGTEPTPSDYGTRISLAVVDAEGAAAGLSGKFGRYLAAPPTCLEDCTYGFFTHRLSNTVQCAEQDRGKRIWFCANLENRKGWKGPPSALFSTVIP